MLIRVPSTINVYPSEYGGLSGLGQDPTDTGSSVQLVFASDTTTPNTASDVLANMPTLTAPAYVPTPSAADLTANPDILSSALPTGASSSSGSSSPSSTTAQDIAALGPALAAAAKGISAASGPYQIPGSNYIYNPATGQILLNGTAVGTYNPATGVASVISSITSMLPLFIGIAAVIGVVMLIGGKK